MAKAPFNLAHPGAAVTLARYFAKRAIKAEWRKAGVKVAYVDGKDLNIAAWAYLHEHLEELIGEAKATLTEWSNSSTITNTPRSPSPPTKGKSNHDHDHANNSKPNTTEEVA